MSLSLCERVWRLAILLIADDVRPAAERLKNVAPGARPGYACRQMLSPVGAKDFKLRLSPRRGLIEQAVDRIFLIRRDGRLGPANQYRDAVDVEFLESLS